ncbi:MAG: hypothetical protein Q9170_000353 [Blastenia crenularia]
MAQAFRFGFGDGDVEADDFDGDDAPQDNIKSTTKEAPNNLNAPRSLNLYDMLSALPSNIQYNTIQLCPSEDETIFLPRRELFDIRAQLMAEDFSFDEGSTAGIDTDDIKPNIYEGGFKTWECSIDLAKYLLDQASALSPFLLKPCTIIELGAGTALPTLLLLHFLFSASPLSESPRRTLIAADYNPSVLSLTTIPNLLLTYALTSRLISHASGDLEVTPALLSSFQQALTERNIRIAAVAGVWGSSLASILTSIESSGSDSAPHGNTLILASETIYSPSSTLAFTLTLLDAIRKFKEVGMITALVAAKRVYFGVGGGVDEFLGVLREHGAEGKEVWTTEGMKSGVGRCILEVMTGTE